MRDQSVQTKKQNKKLFTFLLATKNVIIAIVESRTTGKGNSQLQQRESNRNVMNGCHLAVGRSRIDRWYITTLERPNRTDRPAFNRHDSSLGLFLNYITTTSPIFIFFFSGKAIQWKEKWIYWTRELLRRKWNIYIFFYWGCRHPSEKGIPFFFFFQIDGDHWEPIEKADAWRQRKSNQTLSNISCMNSTLSLHPANPNARRAEIVFSVANEFTDWSCDFSGKIMTLPEKGKRPKKK